ncbi:MAG: shikimate dehydrogenase [Alphaproteobacteria bacterium]|nr:shikimate dehydrogenase [Alphaproteobacteria bacterium]
MLSGLNGATRIHVTIGDPIAQVKSPAGITQGFEMRGLDAIMIPLQVKPADVGDFFALARRLPTLDGIVITVPHKPVAFRHCDTTSQRAKVLEVCNVMRREKDGSWTGDMTDGGGFVAALKRNEFDPKGKRALQVGAGGAGSAIALALAMEGASVTLADLDVGKRDALIARLGRHGHAITPVDKPDPAGFDLIVNATPAGMKAGDPLPVDASRLEAKQFVADVITMPVITPLLQAALQKGCHIQNGVQMFEAQVDFITDYLMGKH